MRRLTLLTGLLIVELAGTGLEVRAAPPVSAGASSQQAVAVKPAVEKSDADILVGTMEGKESFALRKALRQPCVVNVRKMPLGELLQVLSKQWDIKVNIDDKSLEEESLTLDKSLTLKVESSSRSSMLASLLKPSLGYYVDNGAVVVSSETKCKERLCTFTYSVREIVGDGDDADLEELVELIHTVVEPETWQDNGGNGSVRPFSRTASLVVRNTEQLQDRVLAFLAELLVVRRQDRKRIVAKRAIGANPLEQKLDQQVSIKWKQTPLRVALQELAANIDVPLLLDENALKAVGASLDAPLTLTADRISAGNVLNAIQRIEPKVDVLFEKEILLVTTPAKSNEKREVRLYDINDLITATDGSKTDPEKILELLKLRVGLANPELKGDPGIKVVQISGVHFAQLTQTQRTHRDLGVYLRELREQLPQPTSAAFKGIGRRKADMLPDEDLPVEEVVPDEKKKPNP